MVFTRIWFILSWSPTTRRCTSFESSTLKSIEFWTACTMNTFPSSSRNAARSIACSSITIFPLSMRLTSSMSLIRSSRCSLESRIFSRLSRTRSGSSGRASARLANPIIELRGVRKSWDMLVRKVDFA